LVNFFKTTRHYNPEDSHLRKALWCASASLLWWNNARFESVVWPPDKPYFCRQLQCIPLYNTATVLPDRSRVTSIMKTNYSVRHSI
jgi:hypothetical protein